VGHAATGWNFCALKPKKSLIRVEVKFEGKPLTARAVRLKPIPESMHTPMTHCFKITSERQLPDALRVIKGALHDSM